STRLRTCGSSCATTGFRTGSSNHTTISSTIVARPGTSSSISRGASCLSDCVNGRTSSDQWDSVLLLLSCSVLTRAFMSMTPTSRASLADVIVLISQANLSGRQKQELRSAVRTVARLPDGEPANIAADPAALRRCLEMIAPEAHGISRGRWANIRSLLRKALGLVRPMMAGRSVQPILPAWEVLTVNLPFSRSVRLIPGVRVPSARARGPTGVTMADLEDYRE